MSHQETGSGLIVPRAKDLTQRLERLADKLVSFYRKDWFVLAWLFLMLLAAFAQYRTADPDLFARVAAGRLFVATGHVPQTDPFAYTPRKPLWIDHEWLSGVVFYHLSQIGGDWLLFATKVSLAFLTTFILLRAHNTIRRTLTPCFPLLLLTIYPSFYVWGSTVRSQVFTYLFLAFLLWALAVYENSQKSSGLLLQPLVFFLWANSHGGFVVGLGVFGLYVIGRRLSSCPGTSLLPEMVFLACGAVTFVNPYPGLAYWRYILDAVAMSRPDITEWAADSVFSLSTLIVHILLLGFLWGWWHTGKQRRLGDLLLMLSSAFFAYKHQRLHAVFLFVAAAQGAPYIENAWNAVKRRTTGYHQRLARTGAAAMMLTLLWFSIHLIAEIRRNPEPITYDSYPCLATDWLIQDATATSRTPAAQPRKLLVDFAQGSFALWRLYPDYLVSIDGRYEEVYPNDTYEKVQCALEPSRPCHKASLREMHPDYILLRIKSSAFKNRDGFGHDWEVMYQDTQYAVLGQTNRLSVGQPASGCIPQLPVSPVDIWHPRF